jgi:hypothetical protein
MVIDALDESQEGTRRQFQAKLQDLQAVHDIRLLVTSRFIPDIRAVFGEALRLEVRASREDIERFADGQLYRLPACIQGKEKLQKIVKEQIATAVDGM